MALLLMVAQCIDCESDKNTTIQIPFTTIQKFGTRRALNTNSDWNSWANNACSSSGENCTAVERVMANAENMYKYAREQYHSEHRDLVTTKVVENDCKLLSLFDICG